MRRILLPTLGVALGIYACSGASPTAPGRSSEPAAQGQDGGVSSHDPSIPGPVGLPGSGGSTPPLPAPGGPPSPGPVSPPGIPGSGGSLPGCGNQCGTPGTPGGGGGGGGGPTPPPNLQKQTFSTVVPANGFNQASSTLVVQDLRGIVEYAVVHVFATVPDINATSVQITEFPADNASGFSFAAVFLNDLDDETVLEGNSLGSACGEAGGASFDPFEGDSIFDDGPPYAGTYAAFNGSPDLDNAWGQTAEEHDGDWTLLVDALGGIDGTVTIFCWSVDVYTSVP